MTTTANIQAMKSSELIAFFNELTGESVSRFASRAVGERRVLDALALAAALAPAVVVEPAPVATPAKGCPACGATLDITPAGLEDTAAANRNFCHGCSHEWFPDTGKAYKKPAASADRAASIAASWADPAVAAARASRSSVTVSGGTLPGPQQFSSLRAAFAALRLPLGQHIKFRGQLKAAGSLTFIEFTFVNNGK